nr:MAG TPA: hypothetical protein [Caudoviricetes sp.]
MASAITDVFPSVRHHKESFLPEGWRFIFQWLPVLFPHFLAWVVSLYCR